MRNKAQPVETHEECSYGCNRPARYKNLSGKLMCEINSAKCPENKRKNSEGLRNAYSSGKKKKMGVLYHSLSDETKERMNWNKGKFTGTKFEYGCGGNHKGFLIQERGHKCECCGLSEWLGKNITLELEHIDGDNQNNVKSNLKLLCPNCHSYTDTWKGKNSVKLKHKIYVSDDDFKNALSSSKNVRQALLKLGLTPKGANYERAYNFLKAGMVKLVDTPGLSPDASACQFESDYPHQT